MKHNTLLPDEEQSLERETKKIAYSTNFFDKLFPFYHFIYFTDLDVSKTKYKARKKEALGETIGLILKLGNYETEK